MRATRGPNHGRLATTSENEQNTELTERGRAKPRSGSNTKREHYWDTEHEKTDIKKNLTKHDGSQRRPGRYRCSSERKTQELCVLIRRKEKTITVLKIWYSIFILLMKIMTGDEKAERMLLSRRIPNINWSTQLLSTSSFIAIIRKLNNLLKT